LADGWLGATCTPAEAAIARSAIERSAADAGRRIDPEHFGMSIGYTDRALDDRQVAALAVRLGDRAVDPRDLVPVGSDGLRTALERFIEVGISKFVVRRIGAIDNWDAGLSELADAVGGMQT
jgi:hypothetical protein